MVFGARTIVDKALIVGGVPASFRAGSYDLTIKEFITPDGRVVEEFLLPAQGIVKVISAEEVNMPADVIGYVLVKTNLCNEGVLSLNIGIVDPGFRGPLQSALINFGKTDVRLFAGDVFGRLSFHGLDVPREGTPPVALTRADVIRDVKQQVDRFIPSTFLNIAKTAEKAAEQAFSNYKFALFAWLPALAFLVALLTFGLNFGNMWLLYGYQKPQDQVRSEVLWREVDNRLKKIESENSKLRELLQQARSNATPGRTIKPAKP